MLICINSTVVCTLTWKTTCVGVLTHIVCRLCGASNVQHRLRIQQGLSLWQRMPLLWVFLLCLQHEINSVMKQSKRQLSHERTHTKRPAVKQSATDMFHSDLIFWVCDGKLETKQWGTRVLHHMSNKSEEVLLFSIKSIHVNEWMWLALQRTL